MYSPDAIPVDAPEGLKAWLADQLHRIANELNKPPSLTALDTEPARYYDGLTVVADGTNWNPGSGAGLYTRSAGAWVPAVQLTTSGTWLISNTEPRIKFNETD